MALTPTNRTTATTTKTATIRIIDTQCALLHLPSHEVVPHLISKLRATRSQSQLDKNLLTAIIILEMVINLTQNRKRQTSILTRRNKNCLYSPPNIYLLLI